MRLLFFLLLTLSLNLVNAQEGSSVTEETEVGQEKQTENADVKADKPLEVETPDSFNATEKLSEDIAAPFPIDI